MDMVKAKHVMDSQCLLPRLVLSIDNAIKSR